MAVLFAISVLQTIARTWKRFQVELHGKYSLQRLRNFHEHSAQISWPQLLFRCIWTLVPCLVYNIIIDMIPLVKPSAGRDANYAFWVRCVFIVLPIAFGIFMQIGFLAPNLDMRPREAGLTSILVTAVCAGYVYTIAGYIAMPVPFVFLTATPPFLTVTFAMFALFYGKKLIRDPKLRLELYRAMAVVISQVTLTVIYPIYIYGFNSIPTLYQTPYMALMPIIKIISKNIKSILIGNMDDLKPEIMFNVDLFNALYVSLAMQKATTISTSLVVMIIDISQACISVYDVYEAYQPLKYQLTKISADYPMHGKNFVEVAIALDEERQRNCIAKTHNASKESRLTLKLLSTQLTEKVAKSNKIFVAATRAGQSSGPRMDAASTIPASTLLNVDAEAFLQATRSLLFTVECVILIEYAEVVIPVFYSIYMAVIYHQPNRQFYATLANIEVHELRSMVASVLEYAGLELLSLITMSVVLHHITGLSPMQQVGFVLKRQNVMVQCQVFTWVLYALQNALEHLGADFSFKFAWLYSNRR